MNGHTAGTQYYDYNRHKLMFDSEDEESRDMKTWEDQLECVDIPLIVDMSHWVGCITRSTLPYDLFLDKISDGIILCNFGNTLNTMTGFGARRQISNILYPDSESDGETQHNGRHNIASFIQWCKTYGLDRDCLFSVRDLADKRDGRRVLRCLLWVGRLAHKRGVPAPQIVKIEEKYGMRYYTFMSRLIAEPRFPAQALFKEEEGVEQAKEKRGSRLSVTSFFGRSSSRTSVNSNASVASSNLTSITEDRKDSIINGTNKKEKKKKKKDSTVAVPDETELITPNSDIQQIYMQIMSLIYHKGFQRAKPRGYVNVALEEWQSHLHAADPAVLPTEEFETITSRAYSINSLNRTSPSPAPLNRTSPDFFQSSFGVEPPPYTVDPLSPPANRGHIFKSVPELDSSSDGAFADDDLRHAARRKSGSPTGRRGSPGNGIPEGVEQFDLEADREIENITGSAKRLGEVQEDSVSYTQSNSLNPKIDFDDFTDSDITGIKRKDRTKKKSGHIKTPDHHEIAKQEEAIKNSDKVDTMPEESRASYGGTAGRSTSRQRSAGPVGLTLGQVLLIIVCPCRLCFGRR